MISLRTQARQVRRLVRDRRKWWSALPLAAAAALVTATYLVMQSLVLSPPQVLDQDLGAFGASAGFGTETIGPGTTALTDLGSAVRAAGFDDSLATMTLVGVRWGAERAVVREADWSRTPFPARYSLATGAWADEPGEVVVAVRDPGTAPRPGETVDLLSGRMPLTVVGVAEDRFTADTPTLLTGPDTWSAVPADTAALFPAVSAYPVVFWDGSREQAMGRAIATHLRPVADPARADRLRALVEDSVVRPSDLIANAPRAADTGNSLAYAVPSVAISLVGALVAAGLLLPTLARNRVRLREAGVPPRTSALLPALAALPPMLTALVVGVALGAVLAAAARPVVHAWHDQPLSPLTVPLDPVAKLLASVVLVLSVLVVWTTRSATAPAAPAPGGGSKPTRERTSRDLRHWVAVLAGVGVLAALPRASSPTAAMVLATLSIAVGAALAPDVLARVARRLPDRDFRVRLGVRQLGASTSSAQTTLLATVVVGCSIAFTVLLSTMIATMDGRQTPDVLPGQVIVADRASPVLPVPAGARRAVEASGALAEATAIPLAFATRGIEGEPGARTVALDDLSGYVLAVDTVAQARSLLGAEWDDGYAAALADGGVIRWSDTEVLPGSDGTATLSVPRTATSVTVDAVDRRRPRVDWARGRSGLTLVPVLREAGLPVARGAVLLADAPTSLAADLRATLRDLGLDQDLVTGYADPRRRSRTLRCWPPLRCSPSPRS